MCEKIDSIPKNWILTTLGEIGIVVSGGTPSSRQPDFWGGNIAWITPADLSNYKNKYIEQGQRSITKVGLDNSSAKLLPKGTVLFSSRAPIGYTVIAKNEIATNQGFKNLILTKSGYSDYIYYYLQASKQLAESYASGTTFLELSATKFSQIPFPLPPLEEQYRIVDKIEELFSELDKSQENLLNAQKQLEIYRQVVLKDAFKNYLKKNNVENIKTISEIGEVKGGKRLPKGHNYSDIATDFPYIRVTDFQNFSINQFKLKYILESTQKEITNYTISSEDVYISIAGTIGLSGIIPKQLNNSNLTENAAKICNLKGINNKFLSYFLNSDFGQKQINGRTRATSQPKLALYHIRTIKIPVPKLNIQLEINNQIEYRFTLIENIEKSVIENLKRIEIFRQVILQKAFTSNLVPQHDSDEPASVLLRRIQKEKAVYAIQQKEIAKNKPRKLVFMESNKTIKEILEEAPQPLEAKEVWQKSVHKDDIEKFYEELKQLSANIVEIREGKTSKLSFKK